MAGDWTDKEKGAGVLLTQRPSWGWDRVEWPSTHLSRVTPQRGVLGLLKGHPGCLLWVQALGREGRGSGPPGKGLPAREQQPLN